jgi:hypothetical protein
MLRLDGKSLSRDLSALRYHPPFLTAAIPAAAVQHACTHPLRTRKVRSGAPLVSFKVAGRERQGLPSTSVRTAALHAPILEGSLDSSRSLSQ